MNDIEILEKLKDKQYSEEQTLYGKRMYVLLEEERQAIENLIKEYKDLEKYKRKHSLVKNNYIPKSKVIELIKQLEIIQEEEPDAYLVILYLQKLLEGDK